ncbi:hypothetical protein FA10DRAFT_266951 [Acaromyces ingoldii]|uniref:Tim17-domain-containing protein n=1 Tax=Acaromyces ingoldii TaxID=215250 RepID=A0A316YLQ3_9BASI|nr:hypothetical protein FA10DRAFT_266951 [Acaromyces ingoldii]PWN90480.1 hypothetical protein FA10DRAFT_266951 [Acaromyces ingoldii]
MSSWIPFWPKRDSDSPQEPPSQQAQPQASTPVAAAASAIVPPRPISTFEMASPTELVTDADADTDAGPLWSIPVTGFALGFCAGMYQSANRASLVFMAENAHRRPDTVQGWYFYNKTKNYRVLLAAVVGGLRTGARVGVWTLAWVGLERAMGELRARYLDTSLKLSKAQGDLELPLGRWLDGGVAGLGIATGASILYRLPGPLSRRALVLATATGASVGALRDFQQRLAARQEQ